MLWFLVGLLVLRPLAAGSRSATEKLSIVPRVVAKACRQIAKWVARPSLLGKGGTSTDIEETFVDLEKGLFQPPVHRFSQDDGHRSPQDNGGANDGHDLTLEVPASLPDNEADSEENNDDTDPDLEGRLAPLLAALNRDHIPEYALSIRQRINPKYEGKPPKMWEPVCGSYNLCFSLDFDDGAQWMIKFPLTGTKEKWSDLCSRALTSEAKTMMFLKREITIPLPEVFDFCASMDNELNCPYILLSFIEGEPLSDVWWGHKLGMHTPEENEEYRRRALEGIASVMKQLSQFSFDKGGFLEFDDEGKPIGVGPMRVIDHQSQLNHVFKDKGEDTGPFYVEVGPFDDPEEQYKATLNLHEEKDPFCNGIVTLLGHLISFVTENSGDQFDLAHPDFAPQNIIVSEQGELRGIIDWDGVAAVPMSIGSRRYPAWLTRDWDYGTREYAPAAGEGGNIPWQDTPEELEKLIAYRRLYAEALVEAHPDLDTPLWDEVTLLATRNSLVTGTLFLAATEPLDRDPFMMRLMGRIDGAAPDGVDLGFVSVVEEIVEGGLGDEMLDDLEEAFGELLETL